MSTVHEKERSLQRQITEQVEEGLPGVEVLAVELEGPSRFCVYVDHAGGVDHALCERVTNVLRDYLREYDVEVSSPGVERPLRRREHFERALGRRVTLRTAGDIGGRKRFRGEVAGANERAVRVVVDGGEVDIPYEQIVRGNLIDEG
jgi:ribosome maturation factor RimP